MKIPDYTIPIYFHAQSDQNVPSCRKKVEKAIKAIGLTWGKVEMADPDRIIILKLISKNK